MAVRLATNVCLEDLDGTDELGDSQPFDARGDISCRLDADKPGA